MIPQTLRLSRNHIEWVLKKGSTISTDLYIVRILENTGSEGSKFAVITSAKLAPRAVDRNLIKRRTYEAIRLNLIDSLQYKLILIPKKKILTKKYTEIEEDIKNLFSRLTKQNE